MSHDPLFLSTLRALDAIFPLDPAVIEESLPEDSPLALPERTSLVLIDGSVVEFDLYQISNECWSAKNADHDHQCGWGKTRDEAIADLEQLCNDDIEETDP